MSKAASNMTKGKGGKNRRRGKQSGGTDGSITSELIVKEEGQEYAQVVRMLGSGRLEGSCFDGQTRLCHIRGKMLNKVWINQGDIILVGLREYQDTKADVILKYTHDDARRLKAQGELPDAAKINPTDKIGHDGTEGGDDDDIPFDFKDI